MNTTSIQQIQRQDAEFRFCRCVPDPSRWKLLLPNSRSTMSTIPACLFMLAASIGLMLSEVQQFMLLGSVVLGSALGSIFQVTRALITKSEDEAPRHIIIYRFLAHSAGGTIFGIAACLALLYWLKLELPLMLMGVSVGGMTGWMSERIAKKYEPRLIEMLEKKGRIPAKEFNNEAPTTKLVETKKIDP